MTTLETSAMISVINNDNVHSKLFTDSNEVHVMQQIANFAITNKMAEKIICEFTIRCYPENGKATEDSYDITFYNDPNCCVINKLCGNDGLYSVVLLCHECVSQREELPEIDVFVTWVLFNMLTEYFTRQDDKL